MRIDEISGEKILEMAFPKAVLIRRVESLEDQINQHLIKLFGLSASDETRNHWKAEVVSWFRKIGKMVVKNTNRPLTRDNYFNILFEYPFGGVVEENIESILEEMAEDGYTRNSDSVASIATKLKSFHQIISEGLANQYNCSSEILML